MNVEINDKLNKDYNMSLQKHNKQMISTSNQNEDLRNQVNELTDELMKLNDYKADNETALNELQLK